MKRGASGRKGRKRKQPKSPRVLTWREKKLAETRREIWRHQGMSKRELELFMLQQGIITPEEYRHETKNPAE